MQTGKLQLDNKHGKKKKVLCLKRTTNFTSASSVTTMGSSSKKPETLVLEARNDATKESAATTTQTGIESKEAFYASPLYDFLSPFKLVTHQWEAKYIIVLFALILKCAVGLGSYSGYNTPPLFGDFEAQRHWMELTINLPLSQWYWFDTHYWGLDYPPLTAYHSYILGYLGFFLNNKRANWFTLDESRGHEDLDLKSFMRFSVILSEVLLYIPGVIYMCKWIGKQTKQSPINQYIAAAAILLQPSLILVDNGHFQYNCVMLGLTVYAINNLLDEFYAAAAACFVFAICFKQMALFYSPIFFAYLLRKSLFQWNLGRFLLIGLATVSSFVLCFLPLYLLGGGLSNVIQSIHRIFPFGRGLFEDKVANFWCVSNIVVKYREVFSNEELKLYSLVLTLAGLLPSMLVIFFWPKKHLLLYALASCSMSFFLFGFQVHEKTILLPLLPITLLYTSSNRSVVSMVSWINNVGLFSLWPLLQKDGLQLQYVVIFCLSNWLIGNFSFVTPKSLFPKWLTPGPSVSQVSATYKRRTLLPRSIFWKLVIIISYVAMGITHMLDLWVLPPEKYPDLWVVLNCSVSCMCYMLFWLWTNYKLFSLRNQSFQSH